MHRFRLPSTTQHGNLPFNQQHEDAFRFDQLLLLRWLLAAGYRCVFFHFYLFAIQSVAAVDSAVSYCTHRTRLILALGIPWRMFNSWAPAVSWQRPIVDHIQRSSVI